MSPPARDRIFVSYSHQDAAWLKCFQIMLQPAQRVRPLELWSDREIEAGEDWHFFSLATTFSRPSSSSAKSCREFSNGTRAAEC